MTSCRNRKSMNFPTKNRAEFCLKSIGAVRYSPAILYDNWLRCSRSTLFYKTWTLSVPDKLWQFKNLFCHTRLHLGFLANLRIWQVPACKKEPQRGIILMRPSTHLQPIFLMCGVPPYWPPVQKVCTVWLFLGF